MDDARQQEKIFMNGEGDNWFLRNRDYVTGSQFQENDKVLSLMERHHLTPLKVLEVGASNGFRLAAIARKYGADCYGVEPSAEAVKDGSQRFPFLHMSRGVADDLPFPDEYFDLVVVNFVLHWVDRGKLFPSAAEIDRVLRWQGHLIVSDFFPPQPRKVRYHHLPDEDVWTYKQDYRQLFTASNLYHQSGVIFNHHASRKTTRTPEDRTAVFLLQKRADYTEVERKPDSE